jgi:hypothetical protein
VAAGNRAYPVGHGDNGEAEGARDAKQIYGPEPMPPTTAAPQPKNTKAKVPMDSAIQFFILLSRSFDFVRALASSVRRGRSPRAAEFFRTRGMRWFSFPT